MKKPISWVVIVIIIVIAGYRLISGVISLKEESDANNPNWTINDEEILNEKCMEDSGNMAEKYPEITLDYCRCTTKQITTNIEKQAYLQNLKKSAKEQIDFLGKHIVDCYDKYLKDIDDSNQIIN